MPCEAVVVLCHLSIGYLIIKSCGSGMRKWPFTQAARRNRIKLACHTTNRVIVIEWNSKRASACSVTELLAFPNRQVVEIEEIEEIRTPHINIRCYQLLSITTASIDGYGCYNDVPGIPPPPENS
jgi:hypothetical protein